MLLDDHIVGRTIWSRVVGDVLQWVVRVVRSINMKNAVICEDVLMVVLKLVGKPHLFVWFHGTATLS